MARFNLPTSRLQDNLNKKFIETHPDVTTNYEGAVAFKLTPEWELYQLVSTCLVGEPKFYKEVDEATGRIVADNQDHKILKLIPVVAKENPEFILQLASYCRNTLNLRSVSSMLLGEAALLDETKPFVRKWTPTIIQRADDLTEVVAYIQAKIGYFGRMGKKGIMLPHAIRKGLGEAFRKFDEYQLAKYNRVARGVKLRHVLSLTHVKPNDEKESDLWKRTIEYRLEVPNTWEAKIMNYGSTKENWEAILPSMPIFATVRNLRNILEKEVSKEHIDAYVVDRLKDERRIKGSRMLPFRFLSALKIVEELSYKYASRIVSALDSAMDISVQNLPRINGVSAIYADKSGSMTQDPIAKMSSVYPAEIARLMLSVARNISEDAITGVFAETYQTVNINPRNGILSNARYLDGINVGGSTNGYLTVDNLTENNIFVDRILLFTDGQLWDSYSNDKGRKMMDALMAYKSKVNPNVYYYEINLNGYGTVNAPLDYPRTALIAGWSERILEFVTMFESVGTTALDAIKKLQPRGYEKKPIAGRVSHMIKQKKIVKKVSRKKTPDISEKQRKKVGLKYHNRYGRKRS